METDMSHVGAPSVAMEASAPAEHTRPPICAPHAPVMVHAAPNNLSTDMATQIATALGVDVYMVFIAATSLAALVFYRLLLRPVLQATGIGGGGRRRHTALLIGLPSSGKTFLLQQLLAFDMSAGRVTGRVADTRTSLQANEERILGGAVTVVDYPGHRRLRTGLYPRLREAATLVLVVDSVTIDDDRHRGANAVAELLMSVLPSPECYGIQRLLVVCAKRDEIAAYSAKAVRRLLERAMAASLQSQRGDLGSVDSVMDARGAVVGRSEKGRRGGGAAGRTHVLDLDETGAFDFEEQLGIPVEFVEVGFNVAAGSGSSGGDGVGETCYSVKSVVEFLIAP